MLLSTGSSQSPMTQNAGQLADKIRIAPCQLERTTRQIIRTSQLDYAGDGDYKFLGSSRAHILFCGPVELANLISFFV